MLMLLYIKIASVPLKIYCVIVSDTYTTNLIVLPRVYYITNVHAKLAQTIICPINLISVIILNN